MSTRCQIGIYDNARDPFDKHIALLYRHSDGYPEGVLPDLEKFLEWWQKTRGIDDTEYCAARLLQFLCNEHDGYVKQAVSKDPEADLTGIYCYGICNAFHGDIEYFYKIYPYSIEVYKCEWDQDPKNWVKIKVIKIKFTTSARR